MNRTLFLFWSLLLIAVSLPAETELEFGGFADSCYGSAIRGDRDMTAAKTRLRPELEVFAGDLYFNATLDAVYDCIVPGKTDVSLKEAYAEYVQDRFDFRLGRQIISWGRADGIQITDIVSPKDNTELIGQEYEDTRLPVDALKLRYFDVNYTLEGIWTPVASFSTYPIDEDNPLYSVYYGETSFSFKDDNRPSGWEEGEWGLRASFFLPALDFSLSFFSGWENDPRYSSAVEGGDAVLTKNYDRIIMAGADLAVPLEAWVIRTEAAWIGGRHFSCSSGNEPEKHQIRALAGADWNPGAGWMITAQYIEDLLLAYEDRIDREERTPSATLSVSRDLFRETLELSADVMTNINDLDSALMLKGRYDLTDDFEISLGTDLYIPGPDENGTFGLLEELSSLWVRGRFTF